MEHRGWKERGGGGGRGAMRKGRRRRGRERGEDGRAALKRE